MVDVFIGKTSDDICPVAAMVTYLARRGGEEGPLFRLNNGRALTRECFVGMLRDCLRKARVEQNKYAGHSFRIGAATTATQQGIRMIKMLGRWKNEAYQAYIQTPREKLAAISGMISHSC